MKILVTGATGKVGSRFVPRLLTKGYDVRILVRDATKAAKLAALGAEIIIGDLFDEGTLAPALEGVASGCRDGDNAGVREERTLAQALGAVRKGLKRSK